MMAGQSHDMSTSRCPQHQQTLTQLTDQSDMEGSNLTWRWRILPITGRAFHPEPIDVGPDKARIRLNRRTQELVRRTHVNLGLPWEVQFLWVLREADARLQVHAYVRHQCQCAICSRMLRPPSHRRAAITLKLEFNNIVAVGLIFSRLEGSGGAELERDRPRHQLSVAWNSGKSHGAADLEGFLERLVEPSCWNSKLHYTILSLMINYQKNITFCCFPGLFLHYTFRSADFFEHYTIRLQPCKYEHDTRESSQPKPRRV